MTFEYDMRDLVKSTTIGDYTYRFTYDGNGNLATSTDPYGHTTGYGYDGYDRLSRVKDPLNNETLISRAQMGNLQVLKQLDSAQSLLFQSIRVNDPLGRLTSYTVKMPDNQDISYTITYENNGKTVIITDPKQRESRVEKNDDGRVFRETDAAGNVTEYFYEDGRGNATRMKETVKSADGQVTETYETQYEYNAHNKIEKIIDPQDNETYFYYDKMGNLTGTEDAEGNKITHEYDNLGRRTKTFKHFANGQSIDTEFTYYPANTYNPQDNSGQYSPANRLKSIKDSKGNETLYEYDNRNRVKKITYPDAGFIEYTYDKVEAGVNQNNETVYYRLVIEKQRSGSVVKHYYDQMQRLLKREIIPAEGVEGTTLETYEYDGMSRLIKGQDNDSSVEFGYDRANRLEWEKQGDKFIRYTYDKLNNRLSLRFPDNRLIDRQFDQLNRMDLIKEGTATIADMTHIGRSYRLLRKQYGNGDVIDYLYDHGRRMTEQVSKNNTQDLINRYKYGYNKVHMKTFEQRVHSNGQGDVFGYDEVYRLKNVKFNVPDPTVENPTQFEREKSISFDKVDNVLSIVENLNGQIKTITTDIPAGSNYEKLNQYEHFDQWGLAYDLNGNTVQKGTQHFTYDYRNQMVSTASGTSSTNFKYDVLGRRTQKKVTTGAQVRTTNYLYSGYQVIEERDGADNILSQYIYGNGIDEILWMDKYSGGTPTPYYFHTDGTGSVTAVTDATGAVVERVSYDLYGMPTFRDASGNVITESSIGNRVLFQGREYDPELNLYNYRTRAYDPMMGRFLQTDPMGYTDSMNLYQAFNMNPVNFTDPMGNEISANTLNYWGSYEQAYYYVKYNYGLYLSEGDSAATAYRRLVSNGLVTDKGSADDKLWALKLTMSQSLDVFDVTPKQFVKDVGAGSANGIINFFMSLAKGSQLSHRANTTGILNEGDEQALKYLNRANEKLTDKVCEMTGGRKGSLGHFIGEVYTPTILGGFISAEIELATQTAQTDDILYILKNPSITSRLKQHVDRAAREVDALGDAAFTEKQYRAIQRNPNLRAAFRGNRIDVLARRYVTEDSLLSHIISNYRKGPDFVFPYSEKWWDMTTPNSWPLHVEKYGPNGTLLSTQK